ncbi:hypothetical protein PO909_025064, partial [Leuciscus waleckii]
AELLQSLCRRHLDQNPDNHHLNTLIYSTHTRLQSGDGDCTVQLLLHLQVHHHRRHGRWEVLFAAPVHRKEIHGRLPAHHRRGVRHQNHRGERAEDQASDLGHGGAGALQSRHAQLLQRSRGSANGLRHHQEKHIQSPQQLADRRQEPHQPQHCYYTHRKQSRSGSPARRDVRGGQAVR